MCTRSHYLHLVRLRVRTLLAEANNGLDGYINEGGTINTKRLQVILDEMAVWEREVFEKEFADLNWYKGKQAKHVKEMESARNRNKLGELSLEYLFEASSEVDIMVYFSAYPAPTRDL